MAALLHSTGPHLYCPATGDSFYLQRLIGPEFYLFDCFMEKKMPELFIIPPHLSAQVDTLCDRFESEFRGHQNPNIEEYLSSLPESDQAILFRELLLVELEIRKQEKADLNAEEYIHRFPKYTDLIQGIFQSVAPDPLETLDPIDSTNPSMPVGQTQSQPADRNRHSKELIVGKYRVVQRLGAGGQGEVFRAINPDLPNRMVVLKLANDTLSPEAQRQLIEEGQALATLDMEGIVRVYDVGVHEDRPFLVLADIDGRSLDSILKSGAWQAREAAKLIYRLAMILEKVHLKGILHRDLKPSNIMIDEKQQPQLLDFGLSWNDHGLTTPDPNLKNLLAGTLSYMAPEQANQKLIDLGPWTDVFGLGATFYHLLTGRPPYSLADLPTDHSKPKFQQMLDLIRDANPPKIRKLSPKVPAALASICEKALAKEIPNRYGSAAEFASALNRHLWRRSVVLAGAAVLGIGLTGTVIPLMLSSTPAPPAPSLDATLNLKVWNTNASPPKRGLSIGEPNSLPVRNGEQVRIEARLSEPAYVHLIWIGSDGTLIPLYPWKPGSKFQSPINQEKISNLNSPEAIETGWPINGPSGLETCLLLIRKTPLPSDLSMEKLIGKSLPMVFQNDQEFSRFRMDQNHKKLFVESANGSTWERPRSIDLQAQQLGDPILVSLQNLQSHFELIIALQFAHLGSV